MFVQLRFGLVGGLIKSIRAVRGNFIHGINHQYAIIWGCYTTNQLDMGQIQQDTNPIRGK